MSNKLLNALLLSVLMFVGRAFARTPFIAGQEAIQIIGSSKNPNTHHEGKPKLQLSTEVVSLDINVMNSQGLPVMGLGENQFEVYEDGVRQHIAFFRTVDTPASIGVVFDSFGSMATYLKEAESAFKAFIETSHYDDEFFLIGVNDEPSLLMDFTDGDDLLKKIASLQAHGNTALQDGVALGLEKLKQARHPKRVLLVISDGVDNHSRLDVRRLLQSVKEADAQIYTIGTASFAGMNCGAVCRMSAQDLLQKLAWQSGGEAFFLSSKHHLEAFTYRIALLLRQQYSVGYAPTNETRKGKWRKIAIKLKEANQKTIIRTRKGYYDSTRATLL